MAVVKELLRVEEDQTLSFGDYTLEKKAKLEGFEFQGDLYKVKTYKDITKLERNGLFVYESVPGTAVEHFRVDDQKMTFMVSADQDVQITVGLEEECSYEVYLDNMSVGTMVTNLSAKLSASLECQSGKQVEVKIVKR